MPSEVKRVATKTSGPPRLERVQSSVRRLTEEDRQRLIDALWQQGLLLQPRRLWDDWDDLETDVAYAAWTDEPA